jgi:Helix-turn-helix domain
VDGEEHGASSAQSPGEPLRDFREDLSGSGWTTTKQAAKVLGVSRRSVQGYVGRGILEAREEGEGVNRRFLISIDSLNALVNRRRREADETANFAEASPQSEEAATPFANTSEGLRHLIERLESRTAEATRLQFQLELTEKAQSTLEDQLVDERRRREQVEAERDELRQQLEAFRESHEESPEPPETPPEASAPTATGGERQEPDTRPWWQRWFGSVDN